MPDSRPEFRTDLRSDPREHLSLEGRRARREINRRRIRMRRFTVLAAKLGLPLLAVLLLSAIVLWPEFTRLSDQTRTSFRRVFALEAESGRMMDPHYRGVDQRNRPYTITAAWATQATPTRVDLGDPKGDLVLESGNWLQVEAREGVFIQRAELLDLSHDVVMYRDDGTVLRTQTASVDIKQGAATSNDMTHAEGPFGVLDSQGFALTDKAGIVQFQGPAKLVLNGATK
ncbi:MAG: LPS export ABC transporter periplasmic protein LptC [Janthinobacterium lividum]